MARKCNEFILSFVYVNLITDGWSLINYVDLKNANITYATGPLTDEQLGRMSLFSAIGGLIGNNYIQHIAIFWLVFHEMYNLIGNFGIASITKIIGVKNTIHLLGLPLIACSLLIIYAQHAYHLYVSRFINGIVTGALIVAMPCLINDISSDK